MTTTLWRGGRIRTPGDPRATALLSTDGDITWVGADPAGLTADRVVDLDGAWMAPAFVDAHVHATMTGIGLTGLDLADTPSLAVALDRVATAARDARGGVVLGMGWDETRWPERRLPTAAELDRASYGGVVYLMRVDGHSAVASSALLAAAPKARAEPGFLPDGLVRQAAHHVVRRIAYAAITPTRRRAAQEGTLQRAAELGIACVHECGGPDISGEDDFRQLLAIDHPVEVVGYWGELDGIERSRDLGARGAAGDLFVDGSLGSHTACLTEPYADSASTGAFYADPDALRRHITDCTRAGLQAGFHAIGDAALGHVLTAFAGAATDVGVQELRAARHRIEHAEMLSADHIARLSAYGIVASVQPAFDARWGGNDGMYVDRLGPDRATAMNPFAAMAAAGVTLAFGADSPVTPLDPWGGVRAAVQHRTPTSALSPAAAFAAHTVGGRRAARDDSGGLLVPGAPATFAVWGVERVVETGLPDLDAGDPICLRTVVRGDTAYQRS
ncbi:MAG: amidohydrolase family protein [Frankiaceae bacterium]|nr:amidohydrolase family protein [Frankiaceae bacterium]